MTQIPSLGRRDDLLHGLFCERIFWLFTVKGDAGELPGYYRKDESRLGAKLQALVVHLAPRKTAGVIPRSGPMVAFFTRRFGCH